MKPTDALRLPRARLTEEQRRSVIKALEILEGLYELHMTRAGISINMQCDEPVVLHEVDLRCKREGWITQVLPDWEPPRIRGGAPTLKGFKMLLTPPQGAYDEVDAESKS